MVVAIVVISAIAFLVLPAALVLLTRSRRNRGAVAERRELDEGPINPRLPPLPKDCGAERLRRIGGKEDGRSQISECATYSRHLF